MKPKFKGAHKTWLYQQLNYKNGNKSSKEEDTEEKKQFKNEVDCCIECNAKD